MNYTPLRTARHRTKHFFIHNIFSFSLTSHKQSMFMNICLSLFPLFHMSVHQTSLSFAPVKALTSEWWTVHRFNYCIHKPPVNKERILFQTVPHKWSTQMLADITLNHLILNFWNQPSTETIIVHWIVYSSLFRQYNLFWIKVSLAKHVETSVCKASGASFVGFVAARNLTLTVMKENGFNLRKHCSNLVHKSSPYRWVMKDEGSRETKRGKREENRDEITNSLQSASSVYFVFREQS